MSKKNSKGGTRRTGGQRPPYYLSHRAPLYFLFFSLLCQVIAAGLVSALKDNITSPAALLIIYSLTALILARWLKLALPWQVFNLVIAPAVVLYSLSGLPNSYALAAMIVVIMMYAPTFWTRVPYFPTSRKMFDIIAEQLPSGKPFRFIDLGCGFGALLAYLARQRPLGAFDGVEISPLPFIVAKLRFLLSRNDKIRITLKNFWPMPLGDYDVVYAFLAPGPMPYLWDKVKSEMKPGSLFITNSFRVEGEAAKEIEVEDARQTTLFIHEMKRK